MNNKIKIYCWVCDFSEKTGEGNLARLFIKKEFKSIGVKIFSVCNIIKNNNFIYKILNYKYISPFVGIVFCWFAFLNKKHPAYINYLPLWNSLIFILLPPNTILGPITGGSYYNKNSQFILRKYIFPILYKVSEFFLNLRKKKIIFSTDLLIKYLSKHTIKKSFFNFIFCYYKKNKKNKKSIDLLIYFKNHKNKNNFFTYQFIKKLTKLNLKIHIVGDYIDNSLLINHGIVEHKKLTELLRITKYTISSDENFYSLFSIECMNNHVKIITNKSNKNKIKFFKDNFIFLDYKRSIKYINSKIMNSNK